MISVEKPGLPEELVHFGVKGMRWGVRKSPAERIASAAGPARASAKFKAKNPTSHDRSKAIYVARAKSNVKFTDYTTEKIGKSRGERKALKVKYLKDPDRATALRMTRGEKVASAIIAGVFAPTVIVPVAVGASAASRVAYRKHVEKKQARGGYR